MYTNKRTLLGGLAILLLSAGNLSFAAEVSGNVVHDNTNDQLFFFDVDPESGKTTIVADAAPLFEGDLEGVLFSVVSYVSYPDDPLVQITGSGIFVGTYRGSAYVGQCDAELRFDSSTGMASGTYDFRPSGGPLVFAEFPSVLPTVAAGTYEGHGNPSPN